jgi:hypothetical protein
VWTLSVKATQIETRQDSPQEEMRVVWRDVFRVQFAPEVLL